MGRIIVDIGEIKVGRAPDILVTMNLGSCVGIALYDGSAKIGGLAHIKLPIYADTAIQTMLSVLTKMGGRQAFLTARIAGGGFMYKTEGLNIAQMESMDIGLRNVESIRDALMRNRIKITGEEVLGKTPRTMEFYLESGEIILKTRGMEDRRI